MKSDRRTDVEQTDEHLDTYSRGIYTLSREERSFLYFNHLFKEFLEQMIPHLKALIKGIYNLQKNWPWHHFEAGYTPLTEKALLLLELVWSLS